MNVFADFLRYLHKCAREYIEDTHANGIDLWRSLEARTEFVLSHPNGWEGGQQGLMRKAAIMGGLVPNTIVGRARLTFVTEGEASLHFCIQSGLITNTKEVFLSGMLSSSFTQDIHRPERVFSLWTLEEAQSISAHIRSRL